MAYARTETNPLWDRFTDAAAPAPSTATTFAPAAATPAPAPTALDLAAVVAPSTATSIPAPTDNSLAATNTTKKPQQNTVFDIVPQGIGQFPTGQMFRGGQDLRFVADPAFLQAVGLQPDPVNGGYRDEIHGGYWIPIGPHGVQMGRIAFGAGSLPAGGFMFLPDSHTGSAFQEAWGNGFGMAMAPFLAGFGGLPADTAAEGTGAFDMTGSAGVFDSAGNPLYAGPGMLPTASQLGTNFVTNLLNSGGNVGAALKGTALNTGISTGANLVASGINSVFAPANTPSRFGEDVLYAEPPADVDDPLKRLLADAGGMLDTGLPPWAQSDAPSYHQTLQQALGVEPYTPPSTVDWSAVPATSVLPAGLLDATAQHQTLRQALGVEPYTPPSVEGGAATEAPATVPPPSPDQQVVKAQQIERLAKLGTAIANLHGGNPTPQDAPRPPQRQEGESDADYQQSVNEYAEQLVQYANIDPQALADMGLTPGTSSYYEFIMSQMDFVIAQVTGGLDTNESPEDLAAQLRTKTREELDMLQRALYVRGQLGQLMGSGRYLNPFSNITEDVTAPEGQQFNPALGAYDRGLARDVEHLAGLRGDEARRFIGGMLDDRNPDLFGMQARADQRRQLEELMAQDAFDPLKRRRGYEMPADYLAAIDAMSPDQLLALLRSFG